MSAPASVSALASRVVVLVAAEGLGALPTAQEYGQARLASLAKVIADLAINEAHFDCIEILRGAGRCLAKLVASNLPEFLNRGCKHVNIALVGSVWDSFDVMKGAFYTEIKSSRFKGDLYLKFCRLRDTAAIGAAWDVLECVVHAHGKRLSPSSCLTRLHLFDTFGSLEICEK